AHLNVRRWERLAPLHLEIRRSGRISNRRVPGGGDEAKSGCGYLDSHLALAHETGRRRDS
ncbi:MAG: hypothetical protein ACKO8Y_05045, partial [Actinomycetota bacterium]